MADTSVRLATVKDAAAVARVQADSWQQTFGGSLPPVVLDQLRGPEAVTQWEQAVLDPPTPRHRLLVALSGDDVVGFAALGPSSDPDADPGAEAELLAIGVLPDRARQGHGSRLVNASVDHLRGDGFATAYVWVTPTDSLRPFLESAGWAADGARRSLDLHGDGAVIVDQLRLHAGLTETA
jgi:GNAT superfamily N-acetyltransferase